MISVVGPWQINMPKNLPGSPSSRIGFWMNADASVIIVSRVEIIILNEYVCQSYTEAAPDKLNNLVICLKALNFLRVTILKGQEVLSYCITILYYNFQTDRNVIRSWQCSSPNYCNLQSVNTCLRRRTTWSWCANDHLTVLDIHIVRLAFYISCLKSRQISIKVLST